MVVLQRMAKMNKQDIPEDVVLAEANKEGKNTTVIDLFRTKKLAASFGTQGYVPF